MDNVSNLTWREIKVFCFVYVVKEFHEFKDDCNILELIIV